MNNTKTFTSIKKSPLGYTEYVPNYPWTLGTEDLPNPDDLADWD